MGMFYTAGNWHIGKGLLSAAKSFKFSKFLNLLMFEAQDIDLAPQQMSMLNRQGASKTEGRPPPSLKRVFEKQWRSHGSRTCTDTFTVPQVPSFALWPCYGRRRWSNFTSLI